MDFERMARELLAVEYERSIGEGPYPTYAELARSGSGDFTLCSIRAVQAAFAAGREAMRADAERAVLDLIYQDDVHPESGYANDMREAASAIRALPGKEGE